MTKTPFDKAKPGEAPKRTVRPRLAATLILLDKSEEPRVLMGRRAEAHRFMPNKYVFPGGRVDRADSYARTVGTLHDGAFAALKDVLSERRVEAAAAAAIRETFEETGYAIARDETQRNATKRDDGQRSATNSDWRAFYECAGAPDLDPLRMIARAVTPPYRPIRYDALFFLADAKHAALAHGDCTPELEHTNWVTLDAAEALDIPAITRFVLGEVRRRLDEPEAPVPFVRMHRGQHLCTPLPTGGSTA